MSVTIGIQLGTHEILGRLGKGGMGEVYRARDTKLKREVAIKILPDEFSRDPDRLSRFQREAEVLASLNHPNIAAIYDLEEANGLRFLVLELVEGETLAERIQRGPIPIDEALNIAEYVCEALEAAHEKGVIHRDLKPANVKITSDGKVKVLDFGLAKTFGGEAGDENLSNSPTLMTAASTPGMIMGTAAYMSPEQARGWKADPRSDVFSFGCVLYEMFTGRPAFQGDTVSDVLASVLRSEPDMTLLPANLNPDLYRLLRRCLEKNPKRRWQAIGDARFEIENVLANPIEEPVTTPLFSVRHKRRERLLWLVAVVLFIAIITLAIPAVVHLREVPLAAPPEMRTEIVTPATSDPASFALSPDGRHLVFVASGEGPSRLWLRSLSGTTAQPLAGTEGAGFPFWSPDSRSVGFWADNKLKRVDIGGGLPQTLANADTSRIGYSGTWSPEGVILFAPNVTSPIFRTLASGGEIVAVTKLDSPRQVSHRAPQVLPGGRQFLFYAVGQPDSQGIYLGSLDSPQIKRLTVADAGSPCLYAPPGWLLFVRQGSRAT